MQSLDNPIWHALTTHQAHFAQGGHGTWRYHPEVAPFIAVAETGDVDPTCVAPGEVLSFIGVVPPLPSHWHVEFHGGLLQMTTTRRTDPRPTDPDVVVLGEADVPDMLALIALVFPGYFLCRTIEMGTYLGIRLDGRLVAMAGERMAFPGYREISGVCTHPDAVGRGYARYLVSLLVNMQLDRGETPFLHVNPKNTGAIRLYESLGFTHRRELLLCQFRCHTTEADLSL